MNLKASNFKTIFLIKIKFLARKLLYKNLILQALFQSAQHLYEKREGSGSSSSSVPLTNESGSGRPKISVAELAPEPES